MSSAHAEVVVVGAGVMGLAAARALALRGHDVLLLEQFRIGHARGSSHGSSRIFRLVYEEVDWVELAQETLPLWRELEAEAGVELLRPVGLLDLGRDPARLSAALDERGLAYELLDASEVAARFGIAVDTEPILLQPESGVCWASRTLEALGRGARRHGARVAEEQRVTSLEPTGQGVRVQTTGGAVDARVVVVTGGAWSRPLLAAAGIHLEVTVTRETAAYFELPGPRPLPALIEWRRPDAAAWGLARSGPPYALPAGDGLLKAALHGTGPEADPDRAGEPDEPSVRFLTEWTARTFGLSPPGPVRAETCLYTSTPDERFVLERRGAIVVGSACSGHGFKFAPAVGERLAALAARS
jgi:sarcosine oxidase